MNLHGRSIISGTPSQDAEGEGFRGYDPALGRPLEPRYYEASETDIARAFESAELAFDAYRQKSPEQIAAFLDAIAGQIEMLGDELISESARKQVSPKKDSPANVLAPWASSACLPRSSGKGRGSRRPSTSPNLNVSRCPNQTFVEC